MRLPLRNRQCFSGCVEEDTFRDSDCYSICEARLVGELTIKVLSSALASMPTLTLKRESFFYNERG